jgi:hypothetical protein
VFRVDQIGYPSGAAKLAALMTRTRRAGTAWELISRHPCRVVARGVTRTNLGPWSHRYPAVWALRFSGVHGPGTSYSTVEPAIDLTALSPMAFAWQQVGGRAGF